MSASHSNQENLFSLHEALHTKDSQTCDSLIRRMSYTEFNAALLRKNENNKNAFQCMLSRSETLKEKRLHDETLCHLIRKCSPETLMSVLSNRDYESLNTLIRDNYIFFKKKEAFNFKSNLVWLPFHAQKTICHRFLLLYPENNQLDPESPLSLLDEMLQKIVPRPLEAAQQERNLYLSEKEKDRRPQVPEENQQLDWNACLKAPKASYDSEDVVSLDDEAKIEAENEKEETDRFNACLVKIQKSARLEDQRQRDPSAALESFRLIFFNIPYFQNLSEGINIFQQAFCNARSDPPTKNRLLNAMLDFLESAYDCVEAGDNVTISAEKHNTIQEKIGQLSQITDNLGENNRALKSAVAIMVLLIVIALTVYFAPHIFLPLFSFASISAPTISVGGSSIASVAATASGLFAINKYDQYSRDLALKESVEHIVGQARECVPQPAPVRLA